MRFGAARIYAAGVAVARPAQEGVESRVPEGLPDLPPVFAPVFRLREAGDAVARAVALAPQHGAGTLAWVGAFDRIEAAVVLEPEQPLAAARPALLAAIAALADALAAYGPPEIPVTFAWPATLKVNGGIVGAARLVAPPGAAERSVPDWVVVGVEARFVFPEGHVPGDDPGHTALYEEGFVDASPAELTAAWARHLMAGLSDWQALGIRRLAERYLARLERAPGETGKRGLDPATGDLVLEDGSTQLRRSLAVAAGA